LLFAMTDHLALLWSCNSDSTEDGLRGFYRNEAVNDDASLESAFIIRVRSSTRDHSMSRWSAWHDTTSLAAVAAAASDVANERSLITTRTSPAVDLWRMWALWQMRQGDNPYNFEWGCRRKDAPQMFYVPRKLSSLASLLR